jgi:hypothetical protein
MVELAQVRCIECGRRTVVPFASAVRVASGQSVVVCERCVSDNRGAPVADEDDEMRENASERWPAK